MILAPRFARMTSGDARKSFGTFLVIAICMTLFVIAPFVFAPAFFLALLGDKYSNSVLVLMILMGAGALSAIGDVISSLNQSRGWIDITWLQVPVSVGALTVVAMVTNLSTVEGVLSLTVTAAASRLAANGVQALRGVNFESKRTNHERPIIADSGSNR